MLLIGQPISHIPPLIMSSASCSFQHNTSKCKYVDLFAVQLTSSAGVPAAGGQGSPQGPDAGKERAHHVITGLEWINGPLSELLKGLDPCDQMGVDNILRYYCSTLYYNVEYLRRHSTDVHINLY